MVAITAGSQFTSILTGVFAQFDLARGLPHLSQRMAGKDEKVINSAKQIDNLVAQSKRRQAIDAITRLLIEVPPDAALFELRATLRFQRGDLNGALKDFEEALRLNPTDGPVYLSDLGAIYARWNQYDEALEKLDQAIDSGHANALAFYNRGVVFARQSDHDAAIRDFSRSIDLNPSFASALNNRGASYANLNELQLALEDLEKAVALDPKDTNIYNNRGVVFTKYGDYESAIHEFETALSYNPRYVQAHLNLGWVCLQRNAYDAAIEHYTDAINIEPDHPGAWFRRGYCYALSGEFREALKDFERYLKLAPSDSTVHNNLAFVAFQLGDLARAKAEWSKASTLPNANDYVFAGYSVVLWIDNHHAAALKQYEKAFRLNSDWRDDLFEVATNYHWTSRMIETAQTILVEIYSRSIEDGRFTRITVDPERMGGLPTIRDMRIPVVTVAKMVSGGASKRDVLEFYPELELEDIEEAVRYAQDFRDLIGAG